jgi:aminopeptidase N
MSTARCLFAGLLSGVLLFTPSLRAAYLAGVHYCNKTALYAEAQAAGKARQYAPSREIDITHQALDVTPDFDRRSVAGTIRIEFQPIAKPLAELKLDAVDLAVARVETSAALLGWQNTGEQLILTFKDAIPADTASWVKITYSAEEPAKGLYFRTPAMGYKEGDTHLWTQGEMHEARHWFPSYDYPNEKFTTEMICRVPDGMVALSNGKLVSQERDTNTGLVAWRWLQEQPHVNYLVTLCAGYFEKIEDRYNDIALAFWTPPSQIGFAKNSFAGTKEMLAYYEQETGLKYPWARYDQVVVDDFTWGGMENTTQTTLTDRTLFPDELAGTRSSLGLVAHELIHQWFGNYVTCKDWSHIWLNEGFASYYEALYREHAHGRDEFLWDMLGKSRSVLDRPNDVIPIVYRGYDDPVEQFGFRAYPKGAWILHMLRSQLGPDLYQRCVQTYLERHPFGVVTTEDLVKVIEELSGRDWDRFFDQYVYHAHQPSLKVAYSWDERSKLAKVSIQQTQTLGPTVRLFHLPLKIRFKAGTAITDGIAHVSQPSEDFYFALPGKPEIVRVDPDYAWLAKIEFPLPSEMLHAQLIDPSDMIGRVLAIEQLAKKQDKTTVGKLQQALNTDPFWGVRLEAAKALRQIHNDDARTALLAATDQPDARVRREVIQGIASFYREETPDALAQAIVNETNPDLQADVIRALAAYPVEAVKDTLINHLRSTSYKQMLAEAAVDAIRSQANPAYLDVLLRVLSEREGDFTTGGFSSGLHALAVLAAEEEDKTVYREFLLRHVNHLKRGVQLAAIRALGTLGDPQSLAVLATYAAGSKESPRTRAAEDAIRRLREGRPQAVEVGTLRNEVMALQKQNRELKEQFEETVKRIEAAGQAAEAAAPTPERRRGWFDRRRD